MSNCIYRWLVSLLGLLAWVTMATPARAAEVATGLTLEEAISEGKAQNPQLQKVRALEQEASWKPLEAISGNLPKLTLSANHAVDLKYQTIDINFGGAPVSMDAIYPKTSASLGLSWTVFDGFQSWKHFRAAKLNARAASWESERAEFAVENEIKLKYYQALAAELLSSVAAQNVATLEEHLERVKSVLKGGGATKFDLLRVQVQLQEAIPEKGAAEDNVILARRALAQLLGKAEDARPLKGSLPEPNSKNISKDIKWEQAARVDLSALANRAEASDMMHTALYSAWLPRLSLSAEKQYYNNKDYALTTTDSYKDAYFIGAVLTWNLFDGGASYARLRQSEAQHEQAEFASRAAVIRAPNDFELWKRKLNYNTALFNAKKQAIEAADESVRLAKLGVRAGTRTNTDLLDAELDLFRAKAGLVKAQVDGAEALLQLELALGRKI